MRNLQQITAEHMQLRRELEQFGIDTPKVKSIWEMAEHKIIEQDAIWEDGHRAISIECAA